MLVLLKTTKILITSLLIAYLITSFVIAYLIKDGKFKGDYRNFQGCFMEV